MITTITASSITKFLACQRAYYYRYELGLQTVETSDALSFGRAYHAAIEARNKGQTAEQAVCAGVTALGNQNEQLVATLSGLVHGYFSRYVSIHAPVKGATFGSQISRSGLNPFQSTHP